MPSSSVSAHAAMRPDFESRLWVERLGSQGREQQDAIAALHALLLRAARSEVGRRGSAIAAAVREDLAQESADDALVAILGKLADFRGESRFTTWAYKFALYEAAIKVRRRAWRERETTLDEQGWSLIADRRPTPPQDAESGELMRALWSAIDDELSTHQREVLVAVVFNDVPIDVLAERLNTTRGALYKTLHDGRRKLRAALSERGFRIDLQRGSADE